MLKNYIKIAWRNLVKGKLYSAINIIGLAVGIACCMMIGLYVYQELRYDLFHEKSDQIYRVNYSLPSGDGSSLFAKTPKPLAPFLNKNFPEITHAIRLQNEDGVVRINNQLFKEKFLVAEKGFLDVFSFKLMRGNPATAFSAREQILLSESYADKLFSSRNVLGQPLELRINGEYYQATVGGLLKDPPEYSSIPFKIVIPLEYWKKVDESYERGNNWGTMYPSTYVLLNKKTDLELLEGKVKRKLKAQNNYYPFEFQPLTDIHFNNAVQDGLSRTANVGFIYISITIAALILIIACINFMSISIGHSARRAREVGMRKALGALRSQVMKQFWGETFLVVLFSLVFGLLLTELLLPYFNVLIGKSLSLSWMENPMLLAVVIGIVIITGLLAGSYPALYLSKFRPSQVFRNKIQFEGNYFLIRSLSGIQFALAITLIIGTLFMNQQMDLLMNKSLGFDKELVIQVEVPFEEGKDITRDLQASLTSLASVQYITGAWETIGKDRVGFQSTDIKSGDKQITGYTYGAGPQLPQTLDLEIIKGRSIREDSKSGERTEVLVNQELVKSFGWENPIGKIISGGIFFQEAEIVGVVNNFHFQSLRHRLNPLVIYPVDYYTMVYMRIGGGRVRDALGDIETVWNKVVPGLPFDYTFLDQTIEQQYRSDSRWARIVQFASGIAIFLACMGLFGLAVLATNKRAKEISIRKVLGATVTGIASLLTKDFLKPVAIALLIAVPLSYLLMEEWLQNFAYKINLGFITYFIATIVTIGIALATVSWQSVRAALANPVESLRNE